MTGADGKPPRPTFVAGLSYKDAKAALAWLEKAFGFETTMLVEDEGGLWGEMSFDNGHIYVGAEWSDAKQLGKAEMRSPLSAAGVNTQSLEVRLESGLDEHCERARAAGAIITSEPNNQFWGDRRYRALDPEGHVWTFLQQISDPPDRAEAGGKV